MTTKDLLVIIDHILTFNDLEQITLTGGEPFLRQDITELIDYILIKGVKVAVISNASTVDDDLARKLSKMPVSYVQVTLLGPDAETHDSIAGVGSFQARVDGISRLVWAGVNVGGAFVCTSSNYYCTEATMNFLYNIGARNHMCFVRFSPAGYSVKNKNNLLPTQKQVIKAIEQANRFGMYKKIKIYNKIPIPPCLIEYNKYSNVLFASCGAGALEGECYVDYMGRLKLCGLQKEFLGSIFLSDMYGHLLSRYIYKLRKRIPLFCHDCPLWYYCLGGCPAAAEWAENFLNIDPFMVLQINHKSESSKMKRFKKLKE